MAPKVIEDLLERVAGAAELDSVAQPLAKKVSEVIPHGPVKDVLSGTWLGHPLHPLLTDIPIGSWTSAMILDFFGGKKSRPAADLLVGVGVISALPTAVSGLADWSDTLGGERRLGFAHAVGNVAAVTLYALSWRARRRDKRIRGVFLGVLGSGAATAGAYIGGHLAWRLGVNVDRHAWDHPADDWMDAAAEADLREGEPLLAKAGVRDPNAVDDGQDGHREDVLLVRQGGAVRAIADVCGHAGGPLHDGEVDAEGCVTCPWHGSVFRLEDGSVVHGPATGPQPAYDVRVLGGRVSVRRR